jgi:hypothetical protein
MVQDWILRQNLRAFLTAVSWVVGYPFGADDWAAIEHGVRESDDETGQRYEYTFAGQQAAKLLLARDPGTAVVHVRVEAAAEVEPQIRLALSIFQHFHIEGADHN